MSAESQWSVGVDEPEATTSKPEAVINEPDAVSSEPDAVRSAPVVNAPTAADLSQLPPPAAGVASHGRPDAPGWSSAATAIHSLWKMQAPMLLVLDPEGYGSIVIDVQQNEFAWELPLDRFPSDPASVGVSTHPLAADSPMRDSSARNLDALLWMIGLNSFAGDLAWWLPEVERYHLTRWPNLTELAHTPAQMRMIAMLANAYFTPAELAATATSDPVEARALVNALSLMGILKSSSTEPEPMPRGELAAPSSKGLFQRLLDRLAPRG